MELQALERRLTGDGFIAAFVAASEDMDADHVNVALNTDGFARPLTLQITRIESEPGAMSGLGLVQLFVALPIEVAQEAVRDVLEVLPEINEATPLIGFNLHPEGPFVYFRHVMLVPEGESGLRVVNQAVWLVNFALDLFASELAKVIRGRRARG